MPITDYEFFEVPPRWQLLKLETSDGRVGWGEVYPMWHYAGDSTPATRDAVSQLFYQYVDGADPARIEHLWQAMYRSSFFRGGPVHMSAIAGIDQALWDLKGTEFDAPVYELLGGAARDRIRVYQHVSANREDGVEDPAAAAAAEAREHVDDGFQAVKLVPTPGLEPIATAAAVEGAVQVVSAVRTEVGPEVDVALDLHGRATKATARRLVAALEPYDPLFIEEPVTPGQIDEFERLAAHTTVPIAAGERLHTRWDFRPLLEADAIDVVQPDVSNAGGITETAKIASMAETYDVTIAPHCPLGPFATAASMQVDAVAPNALIQEQILHTVPEGFEYVENPGVFGVADGFLDLPGGPGLGVEIDEERVRERDGQDLEYPRPMGSRADGSVGER